MACGVEVCSAHYLNMPLDGKQRVNNKEITNTIVNSLFSDGCFCAALLLPSPNEHSPDSYAVLHDFAAVTDVSAIETMVYYWDDEYSQFYFHLAEEAPYAVGAGMVALLADMRERQMPIDFVRHVVLHTGGQTVMDSVAAQLGLDLYELSATTNALRDFGNNSSVSYMYAFNHWLDHPPNKVSPGDLGLFITMGPGAGIELCMWSAGSKVAISAAKLLRDPATTGWCSDPAPDVALPSLSRLLRIDDPKGATELGVHPIMEDGEGVSENIIAWAMAKLSAMQVGDSGDELASGVLAELGNGKDGELTERRLLPDEKGKEGETFSTLAFAMMFLSRLSEKKLEHLRKDQ